jgi:hypothetical protein
LFFSVVVVAVFSALLLVGCGNDDDPPPDGVGSGGIVGDWSVVEMTYVLDGESEVQTIPNDSKMFISFKSSGDLVVTYFNKFGNVWIESTYGEQKYTIKNNSMCVVEDEGEEEECATYNISGNTLTVNETYESCDSGPEYERCYQRSITTKAVRGNIASTRSSLGSSLKSQDPALNRTEWTRPSESEYEWDRDRIEFWGGHYYDSRDVYIFGSYNITWYTEGGNRLILVALECDRWEEYEHEDHYDTECVATSISETVTLDYQLTNGTLRLKAPGKDWDTWTPYDYMYKSKSKSQKDRRHINPFKAFRK